METEGMSVVIIKPGDIEQAQPFYCKRDWECKLCGCTWRITEKSDATYTHDQFGLNFAEMWCPTCRDHVIMYEGESDEVRQNRRLGYQWTMKRVGT